MTKLERLLTLPPRAHIFIRNERLIAYERIVEATLRGEPVNLLVVQLRMLELKNADD